MNIPDVVLRWAAALARHWPWFKGLVNTIAINATVNAARNRPHPLSTAHDYVSWVTLSDRRWSGRHLPPTDKQATTSVDEVVKIFKRGSQHQLSNRSSCLFPAFAQYLTDGFIRTRMNDRSKGEPDSLRLLNTSNHEIDMCPLYGRNLEQTNALRLKSPLKGERGRLLSQELNGEEYAPFLLYQNGRIKKQFEVLDAPLGLDTLDRERAQAIFAFGGDRTNASPQVAMINTLFLREHNRLAQQIERKEPGWDDERVFQVARNTVIVLFIKLVVEEYINHISPTIQFHVDKKIAWKAKWNRPNWITTEFSLLYRWHPLVPDTMTWGGVPYPLFATIMNNRLLVQGGLRAAFVEQSAQAAGRLCALNTAEELIDFEKRAIEQGRRCRLPSYAAYRKYVGLSVPKSFKDISKDPVVSDLLRSIYKTPDEVEFYPGLFAEDNRSESPLPPLMRSMVAIDAFSQALTNPLLSEHVFEKSTFSAEGWEAIHTTSCLRDLVARNTQGSDDDLAVGMKLETPVTRRPLQVSDETVPA